MSNKTATIRENFKRERQTYILPFREKAQRYSYPFREKAQRYSYPFREKAQRYSPFVKKLNGIEYVYR